MSVARHSQKGSNRRQGGALVGRARQADLERNDLSEHDLFRRDHALTARTSLGRDVVKLAIIEDQPAVVRVRRNIDIAMLPANFGQRIAAAGIELLRGVVVETVDGQHQQGVGLRQVVRARAVQGAAFVDGVKDRPAQGENRIFGPQQVELVIAAKELALGGRLTANEP